jgi:hypothetical protein
MAKVKVYLDNCAYNRPFDDQMQKTFDYTEWRKEHLAEYDMDPEEFNKRAVEYDKKNPVTE